MANMASSMVTRPSSLCAVTRSFDHAHKNASSSPSGKPNHSARGTGWPMLTELTGNP